MTSLKKNISLCIAAAALSAVAFSAPADAKGCIKGAVVGGVAGHYTAHHGLIGAAAGCVIGRHEAKKKEREQKMQRDQSRRPGDPQGERL